MTHPYAPVVRGIKYEDYIQLLGQGDIFCRNDFASAMQVSYSTATYHLERAVGQKKLNKQYGFISDQPGWLYALPETMPMLLPPAPVPERET